MNLQPLPDSRAVIECESDDRLYPESRSYLIGKDAVG